MQVESILWILLALYMLVKLPSYTSLSVFLGSLVTVTAFQPSTAPLPTTHYWRTASDQGCCMGAVLLPVLLQAMALYNDKWALYARLASFLWIPQLSPSFAPVAVALAIVMDIVLPSSVSLWVVFLWMFLYNFISWFPSLWKVFTRGEWTLITSLGAIALMEWLCSTSSASSSTIPNHAFVALSGVIGCAVACDVTTRIYNAWIRAVLLVLLPLLTVEGALWWQQQEQIAFPRAATWLLDFLVETEQSTLSLQYLPSWPRCMWLVYWAIIVVLAIFCSPQPETSSVVVVRKWFHLVAIFLFLPVTLAAPQLMSLSYAIALCVLGVLETMRRSLPTAFQEFYTIYLDPQKDHADTMVVSHMALILGCAMPLWIYECVQSNNNTSTTLSSLLPLFGILVLGVGDSLGALVGTTCGRTQWPNTTRTLEGSAAMWLGMTLCCYTCSLPLTSWLPAVTFTTLLEAFTTQIDNLVLPLAGAAVLLLTT